MEKKYIKIKVLIYNFTPSLESIHKFYVSGELQVSSFRIYP